VLVGLVVFAVAAFATARWIDARGLLFYESGREIVETLNRFGVALAEGDTRALARLHAANFAGTRLGLLTRELSQEKDGARVYRQRSDGTATDRESAIAEWGAYRETFGAIDEAGLHVDQLERWGDSTLVATVRFEVIGTPKGAPRAGIDRAIFRMSFERTPEGLRIASASLVEGDRVISDRAQFEDVSKSAGSRLANNYYPRFLNESLRFKMIRYGPGGISAADYDSDGFYDLFVPDGVASRLLRNRGDGTFEDVTAKAGLSGLDGVSVGVFADYDNDGHKDVFVSRTFNPNQLFHNNGDGTFTDVTAASGIGADCCTTVASWSDYDNDGDLDLYVGRYLDPRTQIPTTFYARNGEPNQLIATREAASSRT
jgi:hypothetical protein